MNKTYEEVGEDTWDMNKTYEEVGKDTWGTKPVCRIAEMRRQGEKLHRDEGPAYTQHSAKGSIWRDTWFRDDKRHRDDGPADIYYFEGKVLSGDTRNFEELKRDRAVMFVDWYLNGKEVQRFT